MHFIIILFFGIANVLSNPSNYELLKLTKILHITDFHYDKDYNTNGTVSKFCHEIANIQGENLGKFGEYNCDSSEVRK